MSVVRSPSLETDLADGDFAKAPGPRYESVDLVRGAVMVLMVLDHVRDFFGDVTIRPTDLATTTTALFFTRWITHYCAPTFIFLAGLGAYLSMIRGKSRRELSYFLFTRGLWLIFLEVTVIRIGLTFDPTYRFIPLIVFWAIGMSMVVLSALVFLPTWLVGLFGVVLIAGHNAFDGVGAQQSGAVGALVTILHRPGLLAVIGGRMIFCLYPLIPWVGVMAAGYALGTVFRLEPARRRRILLGLGLTLIALFVGLRASNVYGDPKPWAQQVSPVFTALSFINCEKYPPSLLYLLMTLGPMLVGLALADRSPGRVGRVLVTLGRVPLFFFVLQWYVLHVSAIVIALVMGKPALWLVGNGPFEPPPGYGYSLAFVYVMWVVTLAMMYPACAWFAEVKRRRRDAWLSYL